MKAIHLFGGIGGFAKGFEQAGYEFTEHYFSEIDKHAIVNYKYNFPNAKHIGSVTDIPNGSFRGIDIITFGSPCQDFSLAGKREGLKGQRSSLITEAIRLIADIRPNIFIWENVKGAFSSNAGRDFTAILQAFANIGGYNIEWQLLNTRWFLPQNRERIYLVGHLATNRGGFRGVFPIGENLEKRNVNNIEATIKVGTLRTHNDGKGFREVKSEVCPTIPARARQDGSGQPVILSYTRDGKGKVINRNERSFCNTLTQATGGGGNTDVFVKQLPRGKNKGNDFETCPTISSNAFQENNFVSGIRRLTEIECERLQGFPDDYTKFGNYDGTIKEIAKTQRYKMLGNAVSVPVVEEIAIRLKSSL
ncbi:DNA (cytosine-5-)-methyltransferase [Capnocytophaga canimorsus]|uniref:Cytosine-specific methyltransferase n=1 Tax=Capnocytophaga canimorsus TaxID=28188 RepID=A0A250G683_9FLAO|nr:DNA (cytosine-5-)-methyltransferase [Capnocytophaga canimorsus]ATA92711.1 DNA (cytosine-5-)-methyltransferase [Capnocytophaga canimorsus]